MPLFQNSILQVALRSVRGTKFEEAWTNFANHFQHPVTQENIRQSKEEQYQEGFLDDLFVKVLGYVKNPNPNYNLTTELKNIKNAKKTDGAILIRQQVLAVIELKGMDTTDLSKVEEQAFNYKNNQSKCNYVITSNFEKLRFYIDDAVEFEEFNLFTLDKERFKLLYFCLHKDFLPEGKPKEVKNESLTKEDVITKSLYKDYSNFRTSIFKSIEKLNPEYDRLLLFKKTQKLLDRFLFIFFAEDKGLLAARLIEKIIEDWRMLNEKYSIETGLYDEYKKYFGYLNVGKQDQHHDIFAYNGGLFAPDEILDNLKIDSQLLAQNTLKLSQYDFESEVSVTILGHIFEHSLNELEEIENELKENTDSKKTEKVITRRKKDGVFYTPKYITDYIIENTVGKLCEQKRQELKIDESSIEKEFLSEPNPQKRNKKTVEFLQTNFQEYRKWLLQITICDPACGSGAFLNQTLEFLIEKHKELAELEMKLLATTFISPNLEEQILKNNIFGVDINEESVEIAKLSLWLRTAQKGKKLTTLNENIKVGNSLIDDPKIAGEKAFDWKNEFKTVFQKGGFDVVVGNPPYVTQTKESIYNFYEWNNDLYLMFFELILKKGILKNNGTFSFITPRFFAVNRNTKPIREFLLKEVDLIELIETSPFEDAETECLITTIINRPSTLDFIIIKEDLKQSFNEINRVSKNYCLTNENLEIQTFLTQNKLEILSKIEKNSYQLREISSSKRGMEIGKRDFDDEGIKTLVGYDTSRYSINFDYKFVQKKNVQYVRLESFFDKKNLIYLRRVSSDLMASVDEKNYAFNKNIYGISIENNDFDYKFILSLLNSSTLNFYYKNKFSTKKIDLFPEIQSYLFNAIPIPKISKDLQQPFIALANVLLELNEEFTTKKSRFLRRIQDNFVGLKKITKKLDAFYSSNYMDFVKEFQKQKVPFTAFMQDEWEDYFQNYKTELETLQTKIKETDTQLDNLVFELYGLDEEEIGTVIGKPNL
jgi:type I restriction-modification system DNA methylase subunit